MQEHLLEFSFYGHAIWAEKQEGVVEKKKKKMFTLFLAKHKQNVFQIHNNVKRPKMKF